MSKLYYLSLTCMLLVCCSCAMYNSSELILNNRSTEYSYNGGFVGGTITFYPDSTYHYSSWSDDMSRCIDSGSFWLNIDTVHFKSIYLIESRDFTYDDDTCVFNNKMYYFDSGTLYYYDNLEHSVNVKFPFVRTDISEQERERKRIRKERRKIQVKKIELQVPDTTTDPMK